MNNNTIKISIFVLLIVLSVGNAVGTVGTYACCVNSITSTGTQYLSFDNVSTWILTANPANVSIDTDNFVEGGAGIKLYSSNYTTTVADMNLSLTPINMSTISNKQLSFWLYVDPNVTSPYINIASVKIILSNNTGFGSNYVTAEADGSDLVSGWNRMLFSNLTMLQADGISDYGNMTINRIRINMRTTPYHTANVTFDDFRIGFVNRPQVAITFDDNFQSVYDTVYPIFHANGQVATVFVMTGLTANPDNLYVGGHYMNLTNMRYLYAHGWDMGSHTVNHEHLVNNVSGRDYELTQSYADLSTFGFTRSVPEIAYPFGAYNIAVLSDTSSAGYKLGRTVITDRVTGFPPFTSFTNINLLLHAEALTNTTTNATIKTWVDSAIEKNGFLMINGHNINTSTPNQIDVNPNQIQYLSDYLKSKSASIDVVPLSTFLIYTPPPSLTEQAASTNTNTISIVFAIVICIAILAVIPLAISPLVGIVVTAIMVMLLIGLFVF